MIIKLYNYGISITGQLSQAVLNFGLFFVLIGILSVPELGLYSFIMMLTGLAGPLSNAACATQVSVYQDGNKPNKTYMYDRMFCQINTLLAIAGGIVTALVAMGFYHDDMLGIPIFLFTFFYFIRHYKRAYEFAKMRHEMATATDLVYVSTAIVMLFAYYWHYKTLEIHAIFSILATALFFSIIIGKDFIRIFMRSLEHSYLKLYRKIWKSDTRWNLLGTVLAEVTANINSYLIMGIKGAAAFAPVTAAQMPFRGIGIIQSALGSFERPRITAAMLTGNRAELKSITKFYNGVVMLALVMLAGLVTVFWDWTFTHIYKSKFDSHELYIMFLLWTAVTLVRVFSSFANLELQAMREFKGLGMVTGYTAIISTVASLGFLVAFGTAASIGGILLGELAMLYAIRRMRNKAIKQYFPKDL